MGRKIKTQVAKRTRGRMKTGERYNNVGCIIIIHRVCTWERERERDRIEGAEPLMK